MEVEELFRSGKYRYYAASAVAEELSIDKASAKNLLENNPNIRRAMFKTKDGHYLYTLRENKLTWRERIVEFLDNIQYL